LLYCLILLLKKKKRKLNSLKNMISMRKQSKIESKSRKESTKIGEQRKI